MTPGIIGTKIGMTRLMGERGQVDPVTVVKAGPCVVLQVRTQERDGYDAVQLGYGEVKPHRSTKPMIGHAGTAGTGPKRVVREFKLDGPEEVSPGDVVTVDAFSAAEVKFVDVTGITKGKGFTGVMARHGFGGKEASHGVERKHRSAGGIGGSSTAGTGRGVKKGKRMAGHAGGERRTMSSLKLLRVDPENDLLLISGSVPGPNGSTVVVRQAVKKG
ncbi:MAG: 50S ribosomal protein L3 [Phycisphaerae bacterium]|jgi:large subunit ribosomal protein L3